jgi:hypothetical protein
MRVSFAVRVVLLLLAMPASRRSKGAAVAADASAGSFTTREADRRASTCRLIGGRLGRQSRVNRNCDVAAERIGHRPREAGVRNCVVKRRLERPNVPANVERKTGDGEARLEPPSGRSPRSS